MATNDAPPPARRLVRKRILIPSVLLAAALVLFGWLWYRGTVTDTNPYTPTSAAEGPVTQLVNLGPGFTSVRCAIVVDAPPDAVWQVISDYDSHPRFVPYIARLSSEKRDDGRVRLTGLARSRLWGDWPFEIDVKHNETPGQSYLAEWHEKDKTGFAVNRGMWTVKRAGDRQSLVIFNKQMEVPGYPNFLIRNILMNRLDSIVTAMRDEVHRRAS